LVVRSSIVGVAAAAVVLYGCGEGSAQDIEPLGRGHVKVVQVGAVGYTEGTESVAMIVAPGDAVPARARVRYPERRQIILDRCLQALPPRATYILTSFQQPCDAACPMKDAPTDKCSIEFALTDQERVVAVVHVVPGRPCKIKTSSSKAEPR
jgi:hypothetical protein